MPPAPYDKKAKLIKDLFVDRHHVTNVMMVVDIREGWRTRLLHPPVMPPPRELSSVESGVRPGIVQSTATPAQVTSGQVSATPPPVTTTPSTAALVPLALDSATPPLVTTAPCTAVLGATTLAQTTATTTVFTVAQVHATPADVPMSPTYEDLLTDPVLATGIVTVEETDSDIMDDA